MKHYATIFYPGAFVSDTSDIEVKSRDERPNLGKNGYAWRFYDREVATTTDGEECLGKPKNHSPMYYLGNELTAAEAIAQGNSIAKENIEVNGYKRLVKTKHGQMFPIDAEDIVESA